MQRVSHRIGSIAESATLKVDAKAKQLKAAGRPVISFAAGEPDFPTPEHVVDAAVDMNVESVINRTAIVGEKLAVCERSTHAQGLAYSVDADETQGRSQIACDPTRAMGEPRGDLRCRLGHAPAHGKGNTECCAAVEQGLVDVPPTDQYGAYARRKRLIRASVEHPNEHLGNE